jgi:DNA-binding MltR family transcriptional regulator
MEIRDEKDKQLFQEMIGASDRAAAIVASSFLEDKLSEALVANLRPDTNVSKRLFKPTGPLAGLYNKADLAYLMGLISKPTCADVQTVAGIRNKFAHWAKPISFGHKEIQISCQSLGLHERLFGPNRPNGPDKFPASLARFQLISFADMLGGHLSAMARNPDHPKTL